MTDLLTTPEIVSETVKEPARAWFNWWRVGAAAGFPDGTKFKMGPHPSKDVAQTLALSELTALFVRCGLTADSAAYIDTLPEGESP